MYNPTAMKTTRNTAAKLGIHRIISESEVALSHVDIRTALDGLCDRVTIYRVLDRLVDEGLVHRIVNVDGIVRFAGCRSCTLEHRHGHIHFNCERCKTVTCLNEVEPVFRLPGSYTVTEVQFTLSGLCPNCS